MVDPVQDHKNIDSEFAMRSNGSGNIQDRGEIIAAEEQLRSEGAGGPDIQQRRSPITPTSDGLDRI